MTMMMISSMTNYPSNISTLLMKVMTPFLIVPTTIITSMTTCHQISFAKMKKWIPHLKRKVAGSDKETDSMSEREGGSDGETNSTSESEDWSDVGASGSDDANPGPVTPPNEKKSIQLYPTVSQGKDKANLVKLELVNLVLVIGALLHSFHKISQGAARANSCGHIFKPNDCPHYKTYLIKDLTKKTQTGESATQWKMCLFHGVAGSSSCIWIPGHVPKSNWWPKAVQGATNWLEQSIKYPSIWQGLPWWDSFHRMVSWYIQALQHSGWHICSSLWTHFFPGPYSCCQKWPPGYWVSIFHSFNHPSEV